MAMTLCYTTGTKLNNIITNCHLGFARFDPAVNQLIGLFHKMAGHSLHVQNEFFGNKFVLKSGKSYATIIAIIRPLKLHPKLA